MGFSNLAATLLLMRVTICAALHFSNKPLKASMKLGFSNLAAILPLMRVTNCSAQNFSNRPLTVP